MRQKSELQSVPTVVLEPSGIYKYIQIRCVKGDEQFWFIRGSANYELHAENFKAFSKELTQIGFSNVKLRMSCIEAKEPKGSKVQFKVLGGGRIKVQNGKFFIYGYSQSYGICEHEQTKKLIVEHLGVSASSINCSNQGY